MQIIVTWSNGTKSELEVEVPVGVQPMPTGLKAAVPETALHRQEDGTWACFSQGRVLLGYCLPSEMLGRRLEGMSWREACNDVAVSHGIRYFNEADWERDRALRLQHAHRFHFAGHATEQEAIDCYQEFLRDFGEKELS